MKITISSGGANEAREVSVEREGEEAVSFKAKNLTEAHKLIAQGRKDGWESLKPKKER